MTSITMPKLSDTMTEGVFGIWRKSVGERIEKGEVVAEVETDKATMELEAFAAGVLLEQRVQPGETVPVGAVIGLIGEPEERELPEPAPPSPASPMPEPASRNEPPAAPAVGQEPQPPEEAKRSAEFRLPEPGPETDLRPETGKIIPPEEKGGRPPGGTVPEHGGSRSAPVVRRRAQELGIDLDRVQGSGPGGRVLLADLEHPLPTAKEQEPPPRETGSSPQEAAPEEPLSRMRAAIARTVSESWRTIPHFSVTVEILVDRAEQLRDDLKQQGHRVSLTDLFVKGAALALQRFPRLNSSLSGQKLVLHREINIGIMAKVPNGLLVPVVRGCGSRSLLDISRTAAHLLDRARNGQLTDQEMGEGTFSISNLGMYGVTRFTAIILPPQVAILALGTMREVTGNEAGGAGRRLEANLSADHRALDGVEAAEFIGELKRVMEHPALLLVEPEAVEEPGPAERYHSRAKETP